MSKQKQERLDCDFVLIDVKGGRDELVARLKRSGRIPVVIRGYIDDQFGVDDGTSIEFSLDVSSVKVDAERS